MIQVTNGKLCHTAEQLFSYVHQGPVINFTLVRIKDFGEIHLKLKV